MTAPESVAGAAHNPHPLVLAASNRSGNVRPTDLPPAHAARSVHRAEWFYDETTRRRILCRQVVYQWRDTDGRTVGLWRWEEWA